MVRPPDSQETTMNWKTQAAAAIVTAPVAVLNQANEQADLHKQLSDLLDAGKVSPRSLDFAQSVKSSYLRYGNWTPKQVDAVRNLIARSTGQAEPSPVAGPDTALAGSLRAALPQLPPGDLSFAQSLLSGFDRYGSFTDRQRPYAEKLARSIPKPPPMTPREPAPAPVAPEKPATPTCPNICAKVSLTAFSRFTVGKLGLSLKNDGTLIWVKWDGKIAGLIDHASTEYRQTRRYLSDYALSQCLEALLKVEADPLEAARENGVLTGRCSCCGRPLTDPVSIGFGIGPICRERGWGVQL
jgi:hypothetical protein